MSVQQARANFSELIGQVYYTKEPVIVEKRGKVFAVVISPEQYGEDFGEEVEGMKERVVSFRTQPKPLTEAQVKQGLDALQRARALTERMRARRGGKRLPDSVELIRAEREAREAHLNAL